MTTKEKIIRESITAVELELESIMSLLDATPLLEIINIRKEAQALLISKESDYQAKIGELAALEKEQFAIAYKQRDTIALIDRRVKLDLELMDLRNELHWIERKKY